MKFPWVPLGDGKLRPWVRCGLRRDGGSIVEILAIVDTGADTTTLPFGLVSVLGFPTADLESMTTNAVGGQTTTWKARGESKMGIQIGGKWFKLPCVAFAENTPALLGRDLIFANFKLRMEEGETELRER
jgi:hypothetical protein